MSAYVVDPRTIDYLAAWAKRGRHNAVWESEFRYHAGLSLDAMSATEIGAVLMAQNIRSVRYRYDDVAPDDLPGPIDQRRIWKYSYRPVNAELNAAWVVKSCDCLTYQSCETPDWQETAAAKIIDAIREDAIDALTDGAPWGVTDEDLLNPQVA